MFAACLIGTGAWSSRRCALTWKLWGTKYGRVSFQLRVSAHPTDVIASGLLLKTPCAADAYTEGLSKKEQRFGNSGTLAQEVQSGFIYQRGLLPTVKTTDSHKQRSLDENGENTSHTTGTKYGLHLTQLAEAGMLGTPTARLHARSERFAEGRTMNPQEFANAMLPTPIAGDWKGQRRADGTASMLSGKASLGMLPTPAASDGQARGNQPNWKGDDLVSTVHKKTNQPGTTSQLNPRFVAEMMGFPVNWTELPFQSGERKASKPTETP
jgi:hypothetical protein